MGTKRITITEIVLNTMLVFSVISVIRGIPALEDINKIWIALLSAVLVLRLSCYRYTARQVLVLCGTLLVHVIALLFTDFPLYHTNILFYFMLWVLIYLFFVKSRDQISHSCLVENVFSKN